MEDIEEGQFDGTRRGEREREKEKKKKKNENPLKILARVNERMRMSFDQRHKARKEWMGRRRKEERKRRRVGDFVKVWDWDEIEKGIYEEIKLASEEFKLEKGWIKEEKRFLKKRWKNVEEKKKREREKMRERWKEEGYGEVAETEEELKLGQGQGSRWPVGVWMQIRPKWWTKWMRARPKSWEETREEMEAGIAGYEDRMYMIENICRLDKKKKRRKLRRERRGREEEEEDSIYLL